MNEGKKAGRVVRRRIESCSEEDDRGRRERASEKNGGQREVVRRRMERKEVVMKWMERKEGER